MKDTYSYYILSFDKILFNYVISLTCGRAISKIWNVLYFSSNVHFIVCKMIVLLVVYIMYYFEKGPKFWNFYKKNSYVDWISTEYIGYDFQDKFNRKGPTNAKMWIFIFSPSSNAFFGCKMLLFSSPCQRKHLWKVLYIDCSFGPDPVMQAILVCDWPNSKKSSPLKLHGQMNWILIGSIFVKSSIKIANVGPIW